MIIWLILLAVMFLVTAVAATVTRRPAAAALIERMRTRTANTTQPPALPAEVVDAVAWPARQTPTDCPVYDAGVQYAPAQHPQMWCQPPPGLGWADRDDPTVQLGHRRPGPYRPRHGMPLDVTGEFRRIVRRAARHDNNENEMADAT